MTDLDALYRDEILDHSECSAHRGRLDVPDYVAELDNPLCGDHLRMEVLCDACDRARIDKLRFDGHGCAISQAAASMLAEKLEGVSVEEAETFSAEQVLKLLGVTLSPARLKCALLGWKTLQTALATRHAMARRDQVAKDNSLTVIDAIPGKSKPNAGV